ncbi:TIGR04282 family arsenosugar biosynthesis glycosyltransferase [Rhodoferax sp.]|uniref:TIGR04282 family arsenosugar biosynthesis glycosyltransferase n=1 Tax=Rhodoferax sp. TaxID=50421 RepID=UPI0025F4A0B1|nr:TIGR04282 family arsenosugar biosynthesis glycosyltransferase [Rhodoferax sp.]
MSLNLVRLLIFAKAPQAGRAKTRLIPALGAQGAAELARQMLRHTLREALTAQIGPVELCMSPAPHDLAWRGVAVPRAVQRSAQGGGDLGERMARAVLRVTTQRRQSVLLMGTDCPGLTAARLTEAAEQLQAHDAVLVPAFDGGYVLMGLKTPCPALFTQMRWSTPTVALETLRRMAALQLRVWQAPPLHDIDEPADLVHLHTACYGAQFLKSNGPLAPVLID